MFDGRDEADQLLKMYATLGAIPDYMVERGSLKKRQQLFVEQSGAWSLKQLAAGDPRPRPKLLEDTLGASKGGPSGRRQGQPGHSPEDYRLFIDLIKKILVYDPAVVCGLMWFQSEASILSIYYCGRDHVQMCSVKTDSRQRFGQQVQPPHLVLHAANHPTHHSVRFLAFHHYHSASRRQRH